MGTETGLTRDIPLTRICGQRDAAMKLIEEAADLIRQGHELAERARDMADEASSGAVFSLVDRRDDPSYRQLFQKFSAETSCEVFRHQSDASIWIHLLRVTGMERLMDATAREEFLAQLSSAKTVPVISEDNVRSAFAGLAGDAQLIFQRGLARAFADLDKRFKSHDAFKIGSRIILTNVFDSWGSWSYYSKSRGTVADIERVLAVLDGEKPEPGALEAAVNASRGSGLSPRQGYCETRYMRIRTFKNGNAHLWFTRDDLVEKANLVLAAYFGEVLPDGVPREDDGEEIRTKSGLPAKNLSFYRSPPLVVRKLLYDLYLRDGARVLEPSAGEGDIVRELVAKGWSVDAVEIDATRVQALGAIDGVNVLPGNFLRMVARPEYDAVVMNPPFYGTHWMEHVIHAFGFLAPGGVLRAVLPATAEVGQSAKHEKFQAWAKKNSQYGRLQFAELPPESFASSGTRINTVILELRLRLRRP